MYKKIILSMVLIFCLAGCAITPKSDNAHDNAAQNTYIKSVFIAYYELEGFTKNNDEKTFKKEISKAFKELANKAVKLAQGKGANKIAHKFNDKVEEIVSNVEAVLPADVTASQKRFFAIKLLERDDKIVENMKKRRANELF